MNIFEKSILSLSYYFAAKTIYSVHSPLVFQFARSTIEDDRQFYCFQMIDQIRKELLNDNRSIAVKDLGAGSHVLSRSKRTIKDIMHTSVSSRRKSELLFRIALWSGTEVSLELGTCLGISTLYLHHATKNGHVDTVEGDPATAQVAADQLTQLENVKLFQDSFQNYIDTCQKIYDLIYLDGHHDGQATINYVEALKRNLNPKGLIILDDIYWSKDMNDAWKHLCQSQDFKVSIDVGYFGILIPRSQDDKLEENQHHVLIPRFLKPWHFGIWG